MGNLTNSLMKELDETSDQLKVEIQENLKNAEEIGKIKLEGFKNTFELEKIKDQVLPVADKVLEHEEMQAFYSKTNDSIKDMRKNVCDFVNSIFYRSKCTGDINEIVRNAEATIISIIDALLGMGQGVSYERKDYSVYFLENSLVKFKWAVYFYNIIASKLDGEQKAIVSVLYFRVDVLQMLGTKSEVLIYQASKHFGVKSAKKGIKDAIELFIQIEIEKKKRNGKEKWISVKLTDLYR